MKMETWFLGCAGDRRHGKPNRATHTLTVPRDGLPSARRAKGITLVLVTMPG